MNALRKLEQELALVATVTEWWRVKKLIIAEKEMILREEAARTPLEEFKMVIRRLRREGKPPIKYFKGGSTKVEGLSIFTATSGGNLRTPSHVKRFDNR